MSGLLKRLSLNIERRTSLSGRDESPRIPNSTSFSDFSLHVGQEVDEHLQPSTRPAVPSTAAVDVSNGTRARDVVPSPFSVGSAPAATSLLPRPTALKIPRTSVAHQLLSPRAMEAGSTPRSSLDIASAGSTATPRGSDEPSTPRSPRSPNTPGGRRRKAQKIDGLEYELFCELIRSSSL